MGSPEKLSHGGTGSDPVQGAVTQPSDLPAAVRFPFVEVELAEKLGRSEKELADIRREMVQGEDWQRVNRVMRWSEAGFQKAMAALGVPVAASEVKTPAETEPPEKNPAAAPPGSKVMVLVKNLNIPNQSLVIGRTKADVCLNVEINRNDRPLFRVGMWIEAVKGGSGIWRTRRPRGVGRF